jgi:t-SNARE complex subunit (syntaxin)
MSALRLALPFVQRILPLLDGNIVTAVSNILGPHPQTAPHATSLVHVEDGLSDLQRQHQDLREQIVEQNSSLKRVEDQLEMVREATDRNTLEQQELIEDLKGVGNKVNLLAFAALCLLAVSIIVNVVLYLHIERVLP